jgi:hypothetical protein
MGVGRDVAHMATATAVAFAVSVVVHHSSARTSIMHCARTNFARAAGLNDLLT